MGQGLHCTYAMFHLIKDGAKVCNHHKFSQAILIGICCQNSPVCVLKKRNDEMSIVGEEFFDLHEGEDHMLLATLCVKST